MEHVVRGDDEDPSIGDALPGGVDFGARLLSVDGGGGGYGIGGKLLGRPVGVESVDDRG
jgi:hypothetical protein